MNIKQLFAADAEGNITDFLKLIYAQFYSGSFVEILNSVRIQPLAFFGVSVK